MNDMRDFPKTLKVNHMAAQLAPALYHCRALLYDPDAPTWADASPQIHLLYIEIAERTLRDLAPKNEPRNTQQKPQLVPVHLWCKICGENEVHKNWQPYCSSACQHAAEWRERTRI